jgi:PadR family transcriptional regulator, regulatory protein PadR
MQQSPFSGGHHFPFLCEEIVLVDILPVTLVAFLPMTRPAQTPDRLELFQGTLDLLILRTLRWGPMHGHGIAKFIEQSSRETFRIEHGSLYPALQRLQQEDWIVAEWGTSSNNRRAKFYKITALGRKHLSAEQSRWTRFTAAIGHILHPPKPAREKE